MPGPGMDVVLKPMGTVAVFRGIIQEWWAPGHHQSDGRMAIAGIDDGLEAIDHLEAGSFQSVKSPSP